MIMPWCYPAKACDFIRSADQTTRGMTNRAHLWVRTGIAASARVSHYLCPGECPRC